MQREMQALVGQVDDEYFKFRPVSASPESKVKRVELQAGQIETRHRLACQTAAA